jgi:hypothetical protein
MAVRLMRPISGKWGGSAPKRGPARHPYVLSNCGNSSSIQAGFSSLRVKRRS